MPCPGCETCDGPTEDQNNREQCSHVDTYVEEKHLLMDIEEKLPQYQVARGRDGEKLGQSLKSAEDECLQNGHGESSW